MICRRPLLDHPLSRVMTIVGLLAMAFPLASAQSQPTPTGDRLDTLKQRDQELETLREQQKKTAETEAAIKREIESLGADRRKLNQDLVDTATRIRDLERKIAASEARLKPLDAMKPGCASRSNLAAPPSPKCWRRCSAWACIHLPP